MFRLLGSALLIAACAAAAPLFRQSRASTIVVFETGKAIQAAPTGQRGPYGPETLEPPIAIAKAYRR